MTSSPDKGFRLEDYLGLPHAEAGNRIGIFGGSFNPPHSGHRMVARHAMKRLGLDQVWWLVTPGNPLKDHSQLAPLEERLRLTEKMADHPRMHVCAHEVVLGSPYTAKTLAMLKKKRPLLNFVWIMGGDNLLGFHRWQDWRKLMQTVPVAVVDRPGASLATLGAPMPKAFEHSRISEDDSFLLAHMKPPAWVFLHTALDETSSTILRQT